MATSQHSITQRWFFLVLSLWGIAVLIAGYCGFFTKIDLIWIALLVVTGMTIPVAVYYSNADFHAYVRSLDLKYLTLFHLWRIPAGLWFLYCGQNLLPERFVANAGYGDITVGLLVPVVLLLRFRGKYAMFHLFSILDFAIAVGTGLTFNLLQVPLMENIATFPTVMIPLFGVCVTGALSIMTLDRLLKGSAYTEAIGNN
ncbi:hypothetical protein [Chroococcidiopsis sp. TS-821]|uniref:hypothetical protein n=1 Tax=Chroococcidiopsis sp. TS-821 TaxID=1378066 RepID=UPI000CEDA628|nr:hypothetical protein [Chroococcidiopsis sp. TS-821]PPS41545.1 hypothetical protein B1A85_17520 [Chroococcidiopsis sp. TS-821]